MLIAVDLILATLTAVHGWMVHYRLPLWQRLGFAGLAVAMMHLAPIVQYCRRGCVTGCARNVMSAQGVMP